MKKASEKHVGKKERKQAIKKVRKNARMEDSR